MNGKQMCTYKRMENKRRTNNVMKKEKPKDIEKYRKLSNGHVFLEKKGIGFNTVKEKGK